MQFACIYKPRLYIDSEAAQRSYPAPGAARSGRGSPGALWRSLPWESGPVTLPSEGSLLEQHPSLIYTSFSLICRLPGSYPPGAPRSLSGGKSASGGPCRRYSETHFVLHIQPTFPVPSIDHHFSHKCKLLSYTRLDRTPTLRPLRDPTRRQGPHGRGEVDLAPSPQLSLFSQMQFACIYKPRLYIDSEAAQRSYPAPGAARSGRG